MKWSVPQFPLELASHGQSPSSMPGAGRGPRWTRRTLGGAVQGKGGQHFVCRRARRAVHRVCQEAHVRPSSFPDPSSIWCTTPWTAQMTTTMHCLCSASSTPCLITKVNLPASLAFVTSLSASWHQKRKLLSLRNVLPGFGKLLQTSLRPC